MTAPSSAVTNDSLSDAMNASWYWPVTASVSAEVAGPVLALRSAWVNTVIVGQTRKMARKAKNGSRPSHPRFRRRAATASEWPPAADLDGVVFDGDGRDRHGDRTSR